MKTTPGPRRRNFVIRTARTLMSVIQTNLDAAAVGEFITRIRQDVLGTQSQELAVKKNARLNSKNNAH